MFKLLVLDIDGVLTDGTKVYDREGEVVSKSFYDHDFTAIKRFKKHTNVCFLSGDRRVNENMAKKRGVSFFHNFKGEDKSEYLETLCSTYAVSKNEIAYVGDDICDLEIMKKIKYPMCPKDAAWEVLEFCQENGRVIPCKGGRGVIKRLYYETQELWEFYWKKYKNKLGA